MGGLRKGTRCTICKAKGENTKAVVYLPSHHLALCQSHFISWFEKRVATTIKELKMFKKTDRILVAVSGGKDSLSLWNALVKSGYNAEGFYINLGIDKYSEESKELALNFSKKINKKLHIVDLKEELIPITTVKNYTSRPVCSICGTIKRYYMNKFARENNFNVIATGHNLDDEIASLLGNILNWNTNYLSRQFPVLDEGNGFVKKVKPLCKITEKESALYAFFSKIEYIEYECPFAEGATSTEYKIYLSQIEEKHPGTKLKFYNEFLKKIYPVFNQAFKVKLPPLTKCKICGEPSTKEVCTICRIKNEIKK